MLGSPCSPCCPQAPCSCGVVPTQVVISTNYFPGRTGIPSLTFDSLPNDFSSRFPEYVVVSAVLARNDSIAPYGGYGYRYVGPPVAFGEDLYNNTGGYALRRDVIDVRFWFYLAANNTSLPTSVAGTDICYRFGASYGDGWSWAQHPTNDTFQFGRNYVVDNDPEWAFFGTQQPPLLCVEIPNGGATWMGSTYTDNIAYSSSTTTVGLVANVNMVLA